MTEFRDIPGFEGAYQATSDGRVRSAKREVPRLTRTGRPGRYVIPGRVLKPLGPGRTYVGLYRKGEAERIPIRVILAWTFPERAS